MIKSYGLADTIWFNKAVKLPYKISPNCIIHDFYKGTYQHQKEIQDWVKAQQQWGSYPYIFELVNQYKRKENHKYFTSLNNLFKVIRLVKYNRVFLRHLVSLENGRITFVTSNDLIRPSSFGNSEELSQDDLVKTEDVIKKLNTLTSSSIGKKQTLKSQRIFRSIYFLDASACSGTFERKIIDLFTAFETLFTTDKAEVTFKLALRAAWFLFAMDLKERRSFFNQFKKGYNIRSEIVHGKNFLEYRHLPLVNNLHDYSRKIILKIIDDNTLLTLFSGEDSELDIYFNNIVLGG